MLDATVACATLRMSNRLDQYDLSCASALLAYVEATSAATTALMCTLCVAVPNCTRELPKALRDDAAARLEKTVDVQVHNTSSAVDMFKSATDAGQVWK